MTNHELRAESLLDKWGFYDGDQFLSEVEEYYDNCERQGTRPQYHMTSRTLCEVVKRYLIPAIPFDVECVESPTMHNPIRLSKLDGEEIQDYDLVRSVLEGVSVTVTSEQVKQIIIEITS